MMHYLYQTLTMPLMQVLVSLTSCLLFNLQLMTVLKIKFPTQLTQTTLLFHQIEPLKNGASLILPSSIAKNS